MGLDKFDRDGVGHKIAPEERDRLEELGKA